VSVRARRVHLEDCEAQKWGVATPSDARNCRTCLERVKDFNLQTYPSTFTNKLPDADMNRRRDECRALLDTPLDT
jgi:hypothetical protein